MGLKAVRLGFLAMVLPSFGAAFEGFAQSDRLQDGDVRLLRLGCWFARDGKSIT
jgi:hypothetical protein